MYKVFCVKGYAVSDDDIPIATTETLEEAMIVAEKHIKFSGFPKTPYGRFWSQDNETWYDFGSWSYFMCFQEVR